MRCLAHLNNVKKCCRHNRRDSCTSLHLRSVDVGVWGISPREISDDETACCNRPGKSFRGRTLIRRLGRAARDGLSVRFGFCPSRFGSARVSCPWLRFSETERAGRVSRITICTTRHGHGHGPRGPHRPTTAWAAPRLPLRMTLHGAVHHGTFCALLCRFGEAWAALRAENLLTYLRLEHETCHTQKDSGIICKTKTI
jgi:hypothetical protein